MDQLNHSQANCTSCLDRLKSKSLQFDHPECSLHRPCTGWHFWEPENCNHCKSCLEKMENLSVSKVRSFLSDFRRMLEEVKVKLNTLQPQRFWEYDVVFSYFFRRFMHFDPARPDRQVNIPQSQVMETVDSADLVQEDQAEGNTSPEDQMMGEENPFFGFQNSGTPVYSNSLTR